MTAACSHPERGCPPRLLCGSLTRHRVLRGHKAAVYCGIPDAQGGRILTGSDDYLVKVWNAHTGALVYTCRGHEQQIMFLAVSCDNACFASASIDSVIRTWRLVDGAPLAVLMGHTSAVTELAFCPQAGNAPHLLLSCGAEGHVLLWDATDDAVPPLALGFPEAQDGGQQGEAGPSSQQQAAPVAPAPRGETMLFCSFSPDAQLCAASSPDFSVRLWRVSTSACASGGLPRPGDVAPVGSLRGHRNEIHVIQFNASSDALVTGSLDGTVRVWRAVTQGAHTQDGGGDAPRDSWTCAHVLTPPTPPPPPGSRARARASPAVHLVRWAGEPGSACVIASLQDTTVCVWDAATGHLHARVRRHTLEVFVVEVHPVHPRLVLTAGYDGRVCIWDLRRLCSPPATVAGSGGAPPLLVDDAVADERGIPEAEFDLRGSLPEGAMKLLDARWHPDGTGFVVSDESGSIHLFGTGPRGHLAGARTEQFFARDYEPLVRDPRNWVADAQTQQAPHLTQHAELLVSGDDQPYPEAYQTAFRLGTVLGSGIAVEPLDDETLRNVRVDVLAERRRLTERARWQAAAGNAGAAGPSRGGQRGGGPGAASRGARAGGNAASPGDAEAGPPGRGVAAAAPPPAVIYISDDSLDSASSSSDHDDDFDDLLGAATGGSSEDGSGGSSDDDTDRSGGGADDSLGGGAGPSNGDGLRRSGRRVGTRASARARGDDGEGRRQRRPTTRRTHGDELDAAQPVYATRHASARRAAVTGGGGSEEGGESEPASSEEPSRKRARRDEGGQRRGAVASDELEDSDSQDSARQRRRERERRRRAAKRAAREAKRARRAAGGAGQADADRAGPSHQNGGGGASRPRGHQPGASTFRDGTAFSWLQRTERARGEYVPQLGDQVVYIAQGHAGYLDACGDARAVRPWTVIAGFRGVEPCVVTGLEYQIMKDKGNMTVSRLTLTMADDAHGQRGTRFEVELPDMTLESCPDFIVEYVRRPWWGHMCCIAAPSNSQLTLPPSSLCSLGTCPAASTRGRPRPGSWCGGPRRTSLAGVGGGWAQCGTRCRRIPPGGAHPGAASTWSTTLLPSRTSTTAAGSCSSRCRTTTPGQSPRVSAGCLVQTATWHAWTGTWETRCWRCCSTSAASRATASWWRRRRLRWWSLSTPDLAAPSSTAPKCRSPSACA